MLPLVQAHPQASPPPPPGLHSEGGIWATLFGLLFWDVIFADAPDALRTPFQTAPLDLHTAAFYAARQDLVDARLQELHAGAAHDLLASAWHAHHGVLCRGVNWERHPLAELQGIARACGGGMLAAVCGLLAKEDVGGTGRFFPSFFGQFSWAL